MLVTSTAYYIIRQTPIVSLYTCWLFNKILLIYTRAPTHKYICLSCVQGIGIVWRSDQKQNELMKFEYKVWVCWLYISILHYFIALVKFPIKVHCNVVHLFYFQIVFLFKFVTDLTMYTFFFPYSVFLLSNIWVLIVQTMRCQNRGQWFMSCSHNSPGINNRNYGNDTLVFQSLYLS